jgi:hypothetical protein
MRYAAAGMRDSSVTQEGLMRARMAPVATLVLVSGILVSSMLAGLAATRLKSAEIQAAFFNGQPFTAATPSGVKFKMVFTPDGKVSREPVAKSGAKGEGSWKLDKEGFCTTWKGQQPNCYQVLANGQNKWSVMKASTLVAVWSK